MSKSHDTSPGETIVEIPECPHCQKAEPLCICESISPIKNKLEVLILQHPQEQDLALGTARVAAQHFERATVKVGLSWASLAKALGRPIADPTRWAILYLGSAKVSDFETDRQVIALDRKGEAEVNQNALLRDIEGIVVLDGTWSQAKALWWRNAWMLKSQRVILGPSKPSLYGELRREPRRDGLSTIEAIGMLLASLEKRPDIEETLRNSFRTMLETYKAALVEYPEFGPKPKPKRDFRKRRKA